MYRCEIFQHHIQNKFIGVATLHKRIERDLTIKQHTSRVYGINVYESILLYSISARTNLFYLHRKL